MVSYWFMIASLPLMVIDPIPLISLSTYQKAWFCRGFCLVFGGWDHTIVSRHCSTSDSTYRWQVYVTGTHTQASTGYSFVDFRWIYIYIYIHIFAVRRILIRLSWSQLWSAESPLNILMCDGFDQLLPGGTHQGQVWMLSCFARWYLHRFVQ